MKTGCVGRVCSRAAALTLKNLFPDSSCLSYTVTFLGMGMGLNVIYPPSSSPTNHHWPFHQALFAERQMPWLLSAQPPRELLLFPWQ